MPFAVPETVRREGALTAEISVSWLSSVWISASSPMTVNIPPSGVFANSSALFRQSIKASSKEKMPLTHAAMYSPRLYPITAFGTSPSCIHIFAALYPKLNVTAIKYSSGKSPWRRCISTSHPVKCWIPAQHASKCTLKSSDNAYISKIFWPFTALLPENTKITSEPVEFRESQGRMLLFISCINSLRLPANAAR